MPWSGTGTYTRGYASWTSDATNGLPISATKFDTEDNDFAAGIQNCLTIDNQNKPNASLTWAQALALTKGTDSTVFSIARTGGTNNPSLTWALADSTNLVTATMNTGNLALSFSPSAYVFGNVPDGPTFTFNGEGLKSILSGTGTPYALSMQAPTSTGAVGLQFLNSGAAQLAALGLAQNSSQFLAGSAAGDLCLYTASANIWLGASSGAPISAGLAMGGVWKITDNAASPTLWPAGYLGLPPNNQSVSYTALLSDQAKQLVSQGGGAKTFTIPSNASVAYPQGTILHFVNPPSSSALTISINSDTLTLVPAGSTGSRTLTAPGVATAEKIGATTWIIYGSNLT